MRCLAALILLAACGGATAPAHPPADQPPNPGPPVDALCLARAREGRLIEAQPTEAAGFQITPTPAGVHMLRTGRDLTKTEGEALWKTFSEQYFSRGGLSVGSAALYSIDKCPDVGDASCLSLDVYVCQRDLATLGAWVAEAAAQIGAPDGELAINVTFVERRGPSCAGGKTCTPTPHYSTPKAVYDPSAGRTRLPGGRGRCTSDGDCEGTDRNACTAWWLAGGVETLIYIQYARPTFCGCVEQTCSWFQQ